jgi:diguanylate cyclase (GGDEF)-like protein/PAS domain S-box-containing protein
VLTDAREAQNWLNRFRVGVLSSGVVWGASSFLLFPINHLQHQVFIVAMLLGLSAGGLVSYSVDLLSGIVYIAAALLPLVARLLLVENSLSWAMGIGVLLYLGFMCMSLLYLNRNARENIMLRLEAAEREAAVKMSEQRYRLLLNHSPVGILHYDRNLTITYCNDRFAEILKVSADQLIGLDMTTLRDQAILPALKKAMEGELGHYEGHYSATLSDRTGWIAMNCAPSMDSEGAIAGGVAIIDDITVRKEAENTLRDSENRFRFMLENSPIAVRITKIKTGLVVFANQRYAELTNINPEKLLNVNPGKYYANPDEYDEVLARLKGGEPVNNILIELRIGNEQLRSKWVLASYLLSEYENEPAVIGWFYDISDRKAMEAQVQHLAHYDQLTRLPNRTLFADRLQHALTIAKRDKVQLALMFIDLDKFKPINDTLGHDVGDQLLMSVGQRILDCLRESDTVARIGGDEFVVLLPAIEAELDAVRVAEKIRCKLNEPFELLGHHLNISSSTGIAVYPEHGTDENILIKNADIAMYYAKSVGRDNVKIFQEAMK